MKTDMITTVSGRNLIPVRNEKEMRSGGKRMISGTQKDGKTAMPWPDIQRWNGITIPV